MVIPNSNSTYKSLGKNRGIVIPFSIAACNNFLQDVEGENDLIVILSILAPRCCG